MGEAGFQIAGLHPFELWTLNWRPAPTESSERPALMTEEVAAVLNKAEADVHSLSQSERRELVTLWR
jgi:hypothetical protein